MTCEREMSFSLADALRMRERERNSKEGGLKEKAASYAAILKAKEAEKVRAEYTKEQEKVAQKHLEALREKERKREEDERNTRRYFQLDKYSRKIPAPDSPEYFGGMIEKNQAWLPHGKGQFSLNGQIILKGDFKQGDFTAGEVNWSDGTKWEGNLIDHKMDGVGVITTTSGTRRDALMRQDVLVCYKDGKFVLHLVEFNLLLCSYHFVSVNCTSRTT